MHLVIKYCLYRQFVGKKMVLTTLRPIKKGEQINENYGPVFQYQSFDLRQKKLLCRYWFT